jgi:hypothetical protein
MKIGAAFLWVLVSAMGSGCVSTKYKLVSQDAPPPPAREVNLTTAPAAEVEATVNTVIVFQGPGAWKQEAYWDEYVVTLVNHSATPVIVASAELTDYRNQPVAVGDDPWQIEKSSKTWWQNTSTSDGGRLLKLGGATVLTGATAVGFALSGGVLGPTSAGALAAANALALVTVAIPIYAVGSVVRNVSSRHQVEAEFHRRRLALPIALSPDRPIRGSLFFRVTPGPQRLVLHYRAGAESRDTTVVLPPLAGLHFKTAPAVAVPPPPTASLP